MIALRAALLSTAQGSAAVRGTVEITLNGNPAGTLTPTRQNNDRLHQFALKDVTGTGVNA